MFRKGFVLQLLAAGAILVLALGCQQAAAPQPTPTGGEKLVGKAVATATKVEEKPVRGGTLRISTSSDYAGLDPNTVTILGAFFSLYENLVEPDKDGNLTKEGLAKDWTISADGKSITLKLREGVRFHDGTDFDAAAVKFNIDRMRDPATKSPFRSNYASVASVEVVDNLTVRFNLSQPDVMMLPKLAAVTGGMMVSPAAVKKYGQDFVRNPVGTGPFQFVEWVVGDHTTLKRFDGYWKKDKDGSQLPYLDGVVFQVITDPTTAVANLRTGALDLIAQVGIPVVRSDPNLTYQLGIAPTHKGIGMNTKRPPFDNKALRQAVALAVDREGIAAILEATVSDTFIHPTEWAAYDQAKASFYPARDVAKAKAKMAEAGYPSGGVKVKYTSNTTPVAMKAAEVTKANLAEIGIEADIEALAMPAYNTKVRTAPWNYQMGWTPTNISVGDPGYYLNILFHSQGSRNSTGPYSNPQVDQALDKALVTYDQKERVALYQQAFKAIVEDAPWSPAYIENVLAGMNKKVRNFVFAWDTSEHTREIWLAP